VRKQELPDSWDSHDGATDGGIGGSALRGGSRQAAYSECTMQSLEVTALRNYLRFRQPINVALHCYTPPSKYNIGCQLDHWGSVQMQAADANANVDPEIHPPYRTSTRRC
jgi:hypothetical protein